MEVKMPNKNLNNKLTNYLVYFNTIGYFIISIITIIMYPEKITATFSFFQFQFGLIIGIILGKYALNN
jgi:hypothetical protein